MGNNLIIWNASLTQIYIYYLFVFISLIYVVNKYRKQLFSLFVILIFYTGFFSFLGKNFADLYKIIILGLTVFWFYKTNQFFSNRKTFYISLGFLLFTISFFVTTFLNGDYFKITFSQYSRYLVTFLLFFILSKVLHHEILKYQLNKLLIEILIIQIVLSFIKIVIMGGPRESLVGSITAQGGAVATSLPVLGFIFYWIYKNGKLKRKDWYFIIGLIFIGFAGAKRAIWFIMPVIIAAFIYYVPKVAIPRKYIVRSIVLVPLIFYFGVKLSPTLNPDHKIWGSFDLQYTLDYVEYYNVGDYKDDETPRRGRVNSTMLVFTDLFTQQTEIKDWLGYGLRFMFATDFDEFRKLGFDISHKGSATGIYQTLIANGYLGVFTFLFWIISIISFTKNKRIRNVLLLFFLWEYLFYTGILFREYSLFFLFLYIIITSNQLTIKARGIN